MKIEYKIHNELGLMKISGRLDGPEAKRIKEAFRMNLDSNTNILVDCSELLYLDSSGLGALLSGLKNAIAESGDVRLAGITPKVKMTLDITGANRLFQIYPTVAAALTDWTPQTTR